jgi:transposase
MRSIGLDVHREFCEVAISEGGRARSVGRVATVPEELELFAQSLGRGDRVVLEATGNALAIARIIRPHVAEVLIAHSSQLRVISHAKVKSDKLDARRLAELLAAGLVPAVWIPDEATRALRRRVSRRRSLVRQTVRLKNEIHAILHRNLIRTPEATDLFGRHGRAWLDRLELHADERETLDACLRQLDFCSSELRLADEAIAKAAVSSEEIRRLMTIPGVDVVAAATLVAAIGDISRFPSPRQLVGYLGLHPRQRQSGQREPYHGRISKEGSRAARHVLGQAAWAAARTPGPLRAFGERVAARRGKHVATIAVARKLCVIAWHLLTSGEDYAFKRPRMVRRKLRAMELLSGAPRLKPGRHEGKRVWGTAADDRRDCAELEHVEAAYRRFVADWQASGPKKRGAGATPGRASRGPSSGQAARQDSAPDPAL